MHKKCCGKIFVIFLTIFFTVNSYGKEANVFIPIDKGVPTPFGGILMDEATTIRIAKQQIELRDLKLKMNIEKRLWKFKEHVYSREVNRINKRSWWEVNKPYIFGIVGILSGIALTISTYQVVNHTD